MGSIKKDSTDNAPTSVLSVRVSENVRKGLQYLATSMSEELGMTISKAQIFEMLVNNAIKEKKASH